MLLSPLVMSFISVKKGEKLGRGFWVPASSSRDASAGTGGCWERERE